MDGTILIIRSNCLKYLFSILSLIFYMVSCKGTAFLKCAIPRLVKGLKGWPCLLGFWHCRIELKSAQTILASVLTPPPSNKKLPIWMWTRKWGYHYFYSMVVVPGAAEIISISNNLSICQMPTETPPPALSHPSIHPHRCRSGYKKNCKKEIFPFKYKILFPLQSFLL